MAQLMHYIEIDQRRQTAVRENISLWEGVLVLEGQYNIRAERASHNNSLREYFTLGGCAGPEMQIHTTSHNNSFEREYFTLGGCAGPEMQIHTTSHNNSFEREYFTLGGCAGPGRPIQHTSRESKPQ